MHGFWRHRPKGRANYHSMLFKTRLLFRSGSNIRSMTSTPTARASLSHIERTAEEPRENKIHKVTLSQIHQVNSTIRLLRLTPAEDEPPIKFIPGQWLDVHIPALPKAGGFTITSTPSLPYIELAIQRTSNPPALWLWRPTSEILNTELQIRVGGSFVFPPLAGTTNIKRVVFIAGGVGINPLISMLTSIAELPLSSRPVSVSFLYSVKDCGDGGFGSVLFYDRLVEIAGGKERPMVDVKFFVTGKGELAGEMKEERIEKRRIRKDDVEKSLGSVEERKGTVVYVCGPAKMTDDLVHIAREAEGMSEDRVLCEKWW